MKKQKIEEPKSAQLTPEKIKTGITKLERRIKELEEFDIVTIQERWDPKVTALTTKINDTISEIFGHGTIEFRNYNIGSLDTLPLIMGGGRNPLPEVIGGYKKGIASAVIKLKSLKETLEEKIKDAENHINGDVPSKYFWDDIHPKITSVARSRFESNHYADAVEAAFKEVNTCVKDIVKRKTGNESDGAPLMRTAFSPNNPVIVLDDLSTESGRNIQQGYMEIFAGSMIGIRNPKAHDNLNITGNRAEHFIYLASLLMQKVDERI